MLKYVFTGVEVCYLHFVNIKGKGQFRYTVYYTGKYSILFYFHLFRPCSQRANLRLRIPMYQIDSIKTQLYRGESSPVHSLLYWTTTHYHSFSTTSILMPHIQLKLLDNKPTLLYVYIQTPPPPFFFLVYGHHS